MSQPEGIQPEENEVVENDDFSALEDAESSTDIVVEDDDDDDDEDDSESDDFEEWTPVEMDWEKLEAIFDAPGYAKRKGQLKALTNLAKFYWSDLNEKMGNAHQVLQADRKARNEFENADEYQEIRDQLADKREEIAADEQPFDEQIANLTKAYNERLAALNAQKQAAVGDRIAEVDRIESETVAGIKSELLSTLGATDNAVGEMQEVAKNLRALERMPAWLVNQRKTRRDGTVYTKEVPIFTFPIPNWTKTLGKEGLGSFVAGEEGKKKVVKIDYLAIDGVEQSVQNRTFTYVRNRLNTGGSVTETVTNVLLDALKAAGKSELSTTEKFSFKVNDGKGEAHTITVLGRSTD